MDKKGIQPKSVRKLEAQAELFATHSHPRMESDEEYRERVKKNNIVIKKRTFEDLFLVPTDEEFENMQWGPYYRELREQNTLLKSAHELSGVKDLDHLPDTMSPELKKLVANYKDKYIAFLRKEKKIATEYIEQNRETWDRHFKDIVGEIKEKMRAIEPQIGVDGCIAIRGRSYVFKRDVEGKSYAIKFYRKEATREPNPELSVGVQQIYASLRTQDLDHIAHLAAYSYEDGAHIHTFCPGSTIDRLLPGERNYPDEDLIVLLSTLEKMYERGVHADIDATNILYSKEHGFYFIDYHIGSVLDISLLEKLKSLGAALLNESEYQPSKEVKELDKKIIALIEQQFPSIIQICDADFVGWKSKFII